MSKTIEKKIMKRFKEVAKENGVKFPPLYYSVNCKQDYEMKEGAGDLFKDLEDAIHFMLLRGSGFYIGAYYKGGWYKGNSAGTSDIGYSMPPHELLRIIFDYSEEE